MTARLLLALPVVLAAASGWIAYLRWKDRHRPEPLGWMLGAVALGGLAVGAGLAAYRAFDAAGSVASWDRLAGPLPGALRVALVIGLVEEVAKLLPLPVIALANRHFDEVLDGVVYAGASAIGFSVAETAALVIAGEGLSVELAARALAAPITHALFAAPAGLGFAAWRLRGPVWPLAAGLALSIGSHGAYDLLLARPGLQAGGAGVVLALWLAFLWSGRRLEPDA